MTKPLTRPEDRPLSTRVHVLDRDGRTLATVGGIELATALARELKPLGPVAIVGQPDGVLLAKVGHTTAIVAAVALQRWRERAATAA